MQSLEALRPQPLAWNRFLRNYRAGQQIASGGRDHHTMFVVESGSIGIYRHGTERRKLLLTIANAGGVFGNLPRAGLSMHLMNAISLTDSTVSIVEEESFDSLVESRPEFAKAVLKAAARNAEYLACRLEETVNEPARVRIARAIVAQSNARSVSLSHEMIAQVVGVSRQTVSTELKRLEDRRIVSLGRGHIVINDPERLAVIARSEASCAF